MIWQVAFDKLNEGVRTFLLLVLESRGSSPGRQGFKMIVASDGTLQGSIGGGIMEHKFVELVRSRISSLPGHHEVHRQVHDKNSSSRSGMICSGEQTLLVKELLPADLPELEKIIQSIWGNKGETIQVSDEGLRLTSDLAQRNYYFERCGEQAFIYQEKTGRKNLLHIVGGGHCSLALSKIMSEMDFIVNVYDTRPGLNTMLLNVFAEKKIVLQQYSRLTDHIEAGENVYVIIMTFGYRTDDEALRVLLEMPVRYLGMIGSKKKIEQMFDSYEKEGVVRDLLKKVHAPAGIPIKSETPEEIAISIAGEIIRLKNTGQ